jgi:glutamine---fructose-6-phosphate transaminase (isomerizing)
MITELKMLSANMQKTLDTINDKSMQIAEAIKDQRHVFFCGHGLAECIAAEGALKMKELTYLHC